MIEAIRERFKDAPWGSVKVGITIGGMGTIGSWTALLLARMGHNLNIYDFDTIERHNLSGQLFSVSHIGLPKTEAVQKVVSQFSDSFSVIPYGKFEEDSDTYTICIAGFDSMSARKIMYEKWKADHISGDYPNEKALFVSPMMSAEKLDIFFVTKDNYEKYEESLFEDDEVEAMPCSYKSTSHVGNLIASMISVGVVNHLTNKYVSECREMPFKVSHTAELFNFDVEYA